MNSSRKLLEYISVFLNKNVSPITFKTIQALLLLEIVNFKRDAIEEWCQIQNICIYCGFKLDENHKECQ